MGTRSLGLLVALVVCAAPARADKIDELARTLLKDPSYKVRVQAALVLGKLADPRGVAALIQALKDENESVRGVAATSLGKLNDKSAANALLAATNDSSEFVRTQAKKALEGISAAATQVALPGPRAGARYYLAIGFEGGGKAGPEYNRMIKEALAKELQKLPNVTLSVGGPANEKLLQQKKLAGYVVDGSIQRLSSSRAGGMQQIDCDLKAFVATFPSKAIKMMTTEGASLQVGSGPSEEISGKRDCILAAVEAVRDDVGKFLKTLD